MPVMLMAVELNSTTVNVSWNEPTMPNGIILSYAVYYSAESNEISLQIDSITNQATYFLELSNLTEFTTYFIRVTASTRIGEGPSANVTVVTDPDSASPPQSVTATTLSSMAIELSWGYPETPNGNIQGYIIEYAASDVDFNAMKTRRNLTLNILNDMATQTFTIGGLDPFTSYAFQVAAYSFSDPGDPFTIHFGAFSGQVSATTSESGIDIQTLCIVHALILSMYLIPVPSAPLNFSLEAVSATELSASWLEPDPTNGVILNYTVVCNITNNQFYLEQDPTGGEDPIVSFTQLLSLTISGLQPFTEYECNVVASTSVGQGDPSQSEVQRTTEGSMSYYYVIYLRSAK